MGLRESSRVNGDAKKSGRAERATPCRLLLPFLFLWPLASSALTSDRDQPIHIEADRVQIDDAKGLSIYTGNVIYDQGTIHLEADTVWLYYTRDRKIDHVKADGSPARFRQRLEGHDEDMRGEAGHIEYAAGTGHIRLSGDAHVWRLNAEFSGEVIDYDSMRDRVNAASTPNKEKRVQVIIQPEGGKTSQGGKAGEGGAH
jgi:lipopolysaccharide export system protein LptA